MSFRQILLALVLAAFCEIVRADTWIFQQSLYSHHQPTKPPAYVVQGTVIREGTRNSHNVIVVSGWTWDQHIIRERWTQ